MNNATQSQLSADTAWLSAPVVVGLVVLLMISIIGMWKTFVKAGRPGWAALIPFYNMWVLAEIGGKPGWWGILATVVSVIPFVGSVASIVLIILISIGVGKNFGKGTAFSVIALAIFSFVGYIMLGFGDAKYQPGSDGPTIADTPYPTNTPPTPPVAPTPPAV